MFTINYLKNNCDIKYTALGNNELLQKVRKVDTIKLFFNWDSIHAKLNSRHKERVTRKRSTKRLKHTENLFRKNL